MWETPEHILIPNGTDIILKNSSEIPNKSIVENGRKVTIQKELDPNGAINPQKRVDCAFWGEFEESCEKGPF